MQLMLDAGYCVLNKIQSLPICSIDRFMDIALFNQNGGFYQEQPLKRHFATPMHFSPLYKELMARFIIQHSFGSILEIGPGDGEFFHALSDQNFDGQYLFVEKSLSYQNSLLSNPTSFKVTACDSLPKCYAGIVLLHEVFDCLPANLYSNPYALQEIVLETQTWSLISQPAQDEAVQSYAAHILATAPWFTGSFVVPSRAKELLENLFFMLHPHSSLLIVDYGARRKTLLAQQQLVQYPIRGYARHQQQLEFWQNPGLVDLTYDVDFDFLLEIWVNLGGEVSFFGTMAQFMLDRLDEYKIEPDHHFVKMYLDSRLLGEAFKVVWLKKPAAPIAPN